MKNLVTQILMLLFTREITREIYVYYLHVVYVKRWKSSPSRGISLYPLTFSSNLKQKRKYYLYQFRESPCTKTEEERREERGRERERERELSAVETVHEDYLGSRFVSYAHCTLSRCTSSLILCRSHISWF